MPLTSPGNDDGTGENHQPTLRKNTAEPAQQTLKQYNADFGVPPSPGDADGPGAPFFGAPAACWWTFPPVESMAGTRISTPMIRSSCNAVDRHPVAPFPDQRSNRW